MPWAPSKWDRVNPAGPPESRFSGTLTLFPQAYDVLADHDGSVDHHTDGDGQAAQAHQVRGQTLAAHEQEGRGCGDGEGDRHRQRRAQIPEHDGVTCGDQRRDLPAPVLVRRRERTREQDRLPRCGVGR